MFSEIYDQLVKIHKVCTGGPLANPRGRTDQKSLANQSKELGWPEKVDWLENNNCPETLADHYYELTKPFSIYVISLP